MTFGGKVCLFKLQKGSKNDLLSKIWIFSENRQKHIFFKKSENNFLTLKMEQYPPSCSIGMWNYCLAPSKLKFMTFLCPHASTLCTDLIPTSRKQHKTHTDQMLHELAYTKDQFKPYRPHTDLQKTAENPYRPNVIWISIY